MAELGRRASQAASYDPEAAGAECWRCPLRDAREGSPVPPEWPAHPLALLVGANPGYEEIERGVPFVGRAGIELMRALGAVGAIRGRFAISNAILCCPPGAPRGALERFDHQLARENKRREKKELERIPTPLECCRPRLLAEVASLPNVVTLGGTALHAVTGRATSVMEARGGPREISWSVEGARFACRVRLLPTLHPSFVMSSKRWRGPFRADLARAIRWFTSGLAWRDPLVGRAPSPSQLAAFLDQTRGSYTSCDLETFPGFPEVGHYDPLYDRIGLVGIGTADGSRAVVIPFRSIEGSPSRYTQAERAMLVEILREYLQDSSFRKVGHNFGYYDRMVLESQLGVKPVGVLDTIALHKLADPEMPHGLGFVGSVHTDVTSWKAGHLATDARTDHEWVKYNSIDLAVTARVVPGLVEAVKQRGQLGLLPVVARLQDLCVGLHRTGLLVDEGRRREWDQKLLKEARDRLSEFRQLSGDDRNPGSTADLRDLLFDDLGIAPHHYSEKTGDPSTDDDALRAFLSETWSLHDSQKKLVQSVRAFRKAVKLRGTYVTKLRSIKDRSVAEPILAWDEEETFEERAKRLEKQSVSPGLVLPDGRVHPDYNAHGTLGWRLSSSNCNAQNFPSRLRDMVIPAPGNVLIGCDEAQLELRMIAGLSGASVYCEAFRNGEDPHRALCLDFFGDVFKHASDDQKKTLRVFVKQFTYACLQRGTKVATLDERGGKAIETIKPGQDWTWSWDGTRYVPSRIVGKVCRGMRECVRVRFNWPRPYGISYGSVVTTSDHRFLLRDGTYREAAQLMPSDRLMPFARWNSRGYRVIDPSNDGSREREHRVICGLGPDDLRIVHHIDGRRSNNDPRNLEVIGSKGLHSSLHWDDPIRRARQHEVNMRLWSPENRTVMNERLTAGRGTSPEWHHAARRNLEKARSMRNGASNKGQTWSKLDAFREKIGVMLDRDVAKLAGVTQAAIGYYRRTRKIPSPLGQRVNHQVVSIKTVGLREVWDIEVDHPAHNFAIEAGIFVHNSGYMAESETVHGILTSSEDENGRLLYPDLTLRETANFHDKWLARNPEISRWWESVLEEWRKNRCLVEPILGLKVDFLDGEEPSKMINFKPQSGGSALVHLATFEVLKEIPFQKWGKGTGLVTQTHDSLMVECPESEKDNVKRILEESMKMDGRRFGLDVDFLGEAKWGKTWKEV